MKRLITTAIVLTALLPSVFAQRNNTPHDTVVGRKPNYFYTQWYDTCQEFLNAPMRTKYLFEVYLSSISHPIEYIKFFTSHPIAVKGLAVMTIPRENERPYIYLSDSNLPEYVTLHQQTDTGLLRLCNPIRYDTSSPTMMIVPLTASGDLIDTSFVYEVYFKHPIYVDSFFYINSTSYSSEIINPDETGGLHTYRPIYLAEIRNWPAWTASIYPQLPECTSWPVHNYIRERSHIPNPESSLQVWGRYFALADFYNITTESEDTAKGTTTGDGRFSDLTYVTISARPIRGFHFSHWNDGNTSNPRSVYLTQDTAFTAHFRPSALYNTQVTTPDTLAGHTSGGGTYFEDDTVTIAAHPSRGHRFFKWSDGNTDNPRHFVITSDTLFTALFRSNKLYTANGESNDYSMGHVSGSGIFYEYDTAVFTAIPHEGFRFHAWNDSVNHNPRPIIITQDTNLTAIFSRNVGIDPVQDTAVLFTLTPNPTDGQVTLTLARPLGDESRLTLRDAAGHELLVRTLAPRSRSITLSLRHLPSGPYFLTLTSPGATATQKIILR